MASPAPAFGGWGREERRASGDPIKLTGEGRIARVLPTNVLEKEVARLGISGDDPGLGNGRHQCGGPFVRPPVLLLQYRLDPPLGNVPGHLQKPLAPLGI